MSQLLNRAITDQTAAALKMLRDAIERCPAEHWQTGVGERAFWEIAFHVHALRRPVPDPRGPALSRYARLGLAPRRGVGADDGAAVRPAHPRADRAGARSERGRAVRRPRRREAPRLTFSGNRSELCRALGLLLDRPGPRFDVPLQPPPHPASRGPTVRVAAPGRRRHRVGGHGGRCRLSRARFRPCSSGLRLAAADQSNGLITRPVASLG